MEKQTEFKKRMKELCDRSATRGIYQNSDFLTLAEQTELLSMKLLPQPEILGGYDGAERKLAVFGNDELCGYEQASPIACIKIAPLNQKFADALTHRDFLGALMNLGIKRELLGDIPVINNIGYLFCLESISSFIVEELKKVKHTSVECELCEGIPDSELPKPEEYSFTASSQRLDLIISEVFGLSRAASKEAVLGERVSVNSSVTVNPAFTLAEGALVSLRGKGRFRYYGSSGMSKKGKYKISVGIYK